jgi:hypothetical protein
MSTTQSFLLSHSFCMFLSLCLHANICLTGTYLVLGIPYVAKEGTGFFNPENELQFANSIYAPNYQAVPNIDENAYGDEEEEEEEERPAVKSSACTIA